MKKLYKEGTIRDNELILGITLHSVESLKYYMNKTGIEVLTNQPSFYYNLVEYVVVREKLFDKAVQSDDLRILSQQKVEDLNYVKTTDQAKFNTWLLKLKLLYPRLNNIITRQEFTKYYEEIYNKNKFVLLRKFVEEHSLHKVVDASYIENTTSNILFAEDRKGYYILWYKGKDRIVYRVGIVRQLDKIDFNRFTVGLTYFTPYKSLKYIVLEEDNEI